jgi:hypothetical protein
MRKSTIPEWALARERFQMANADDEIAQDVQFISYLLVFDSAVAYDELTEMEKSTADRLLRMGVLVDVNVKDRRIMLAKPWKRAFESRRRKTG